MECGCEVRRDDDDKIQIGTDDDITRQARSQKLHHAFSEVGERKAEQIQPIGKADGICSKNMWPIEKKPAVKQQEDAIAPQFGRDVEPHERDARHEPGKQDS
ncbi:hypothetical protein MesoLj113c_45900 [Mesorhizobium sp. 113-3-9]|nr:hypothetical protein MesoLj113c_45900 [Mesorhizobium sp. 113-3-9]